MDTFFETPRKNRLTLTAQAAAWLAVAALSVSQSAQAADATWNLNADGSWVTDANWNPAAAPGSTSSTTNTDTATFGTIINAARAITVDANRNIFGINFAGNSSAYTLSGGSLLLTAAGTIQTSGAGTAHTDTINTAITLQGDYTFGGNSTQASRGLTFGSLATITSAATTGTTTLTLNGTTTAANNLLSGIISNGTGTNVVAISKSGTGTWTLSGVNTYSGGTTVTLGTLLLGDNSGAGTGTITLSGGTLGGTASRTLSNAITATAATTSTLQGTGTLTLTGKLSGSGTVNIGSAVEFQNTTRNASNNSTSNGFTGALSIGAAMNFGSPATANNSTYFYNLSNASLTFTSGGTSQWNAGNGGTAALNIGFMNFGSLASAQGIGTLSGAQGGTANTKNAIYTVGTLNTNTTFGGAIVNGNLPTQFTKVGTGTLIFTGANTYTGLTTIRGGTLQVGDGTNGSMGVTALTFGDTGTFNYRGVTTGSSLTLGALTFSGGDGTVQSTYGGTSGNTLLTFASLAARGAGATGNVVSSGGTNGTTNKIVFTAAPTTGALIDKGFYFNGADFAAYDATTLNMRALAYGTDTSAAAVDTITAANHVKLTTTPAAQNSISLLTLNLSGSGTSWTQNAAQTLTLSGGGLIKSGGGTGATISGGTAVTTGGATELVIRTDTSSDSLDIQTNLTNGSTGGLTKSGAGTLTLSAASNAYTGATNVNGGTMVISGGYSGTSNFTVNNSATLTVTGTLTSTAASAVMTVGNRSGNGILNVNSGGTVTLNPGSGNTGLQISASANGSDTGNGTVNVAGTLSTNGDMILGLGGTQTSTLNINSGGIVNEGTATLRFLMLGSFDEANGVVNLATGGTLNLSFNSRITFSTNNGGGTSVFNQNGGNVTVWSGNGTGTTGSAGNGIVDMQGGTTVTNANNTYNLNGGTLLVTEVISGGTTATRTFNFNGGTLKAFSNANSATFFSLGTGNARANVRNGGAIIDTNSFNETIVSPLLHSNVSGDNATDGGLTKNGTGTLTVSGANTYTGGTTVNAGTLTVGTGGTLGATTGALAVNNPNTGAGTAVILNLATAVDTTVGSLSGTKATPSSGTNTSTINNGGSGRNFTVNQTTAGTFDGVIAGAGNFTLGSSSTNVLTLTGANTYTGITTISGGILSTGTTGVLANGGTPSSIGQSTNVAASLVLDGGTLQYADTGAAESTDRLFTLTNLGGTLDASGTNAITFAGNGSGAANAIAYSGSGTRTLTLTGTNTGTNVFAPVLADSGANATSLTKSLAGKWQLTGGAGNTYTGLTTVSGGTLELNKSVGNAIAGPASGVKNSAANILVNGGTLNWLASNQVGDFVRLDVTSGNVSFGSASETLFDLRNSGGTVNYGTGTVVITDPTWSGGVNEVHGNTSFGTLDVSGGTNTVFGAAGPNGGAGTLTVGTATTVLNFSGTSNPNIMVNSDAGTAGKLVLTGDVASTVTAGQASIASGGSAANVGQLDLGSASRTFTVGDGSAATDMSVSAQIIGTAVGLTKAGPGTLSLTGNNTYDGGTVIGSATNGGIVQVNTNTSLGAVAGAATINNGTLEALNDIQTSRNFKLGNANSTIQVDASATYRIDGTISDGGSAGTLNKTGAGTLNLTNANGYTGNTSVNAGTLRANNSSGSATGTGTVNVGSSGTLGGGGTVTGNVTVDGVIAPGNSIGTLSTGALTLNSGSTYTLEIDTTNANNVITDLILANGNVSLLGGTLTIADLAGTSQVLPSGTVLTILDAAPSFSQSGTFASSLITAGANTFTVLYGQGSDSNDVTLVSGAAAIPEPSTWAMMLGGFGMLIGFQHCRRRRS
jgi:autotransporter-associated beta strand protein